MIIRSGRTKCLGSFFIPWNFCQKTFFFKKIQYLTITAKCTTDFLFSSNISPIDFKFLSPDSFIYNFCHDKIKKTIDDCH